MELQVQVAALSRAPQGGDEIVRRLCGLLHREVMRSHQAWLTVQDLTPSQVAGYCGLFRSRKLASSMYKIMGTKEEKAEVERITREIEQELRNEK